MSTTDRQVIGFIKRHHAPLVPLVPLVPPAPTEPVRRGSYADHRSQFPEVYIIPLVKPTPAPAALLACLTILLDQRLALDAILLIAETRGVGAGKVALELATKMALAGIGA